MLKEDAPWESMLTRTKAGFLASLLSIMASISTDAEVPLSRVLQQGVSPYSERHSYGANEHQFALRWRPKSEQALDATLVFVHGGCWLSEYDHTHADSVVSDLAERGFDAWTLEYRRTGRTGGGWPTSLNDVIEGVQMIQKITKAEALRMTSEARIPSQNTSPTERRPFIIMGHSAGGHLALLAAFNKGPDPEVHTIGLAPITHLVAYAEGLNSCQKGTVPFMGGTPGDRPEDYEKATLVNKSFQGFQASVLQGEADSIVAPSQSRLDGVSTTLVPEAGHFDWLAIGSSAHQALLNELNMILKDANTPRQQDKKHD